MSKTCLKKYAMKHLAEASEPWGEFLERKRSQLKRRAMLSDRYRALVDELRKGPGYAREE